MATGTINHPSVGKRIQIPAYCDLWMQGARFGTIERVAISKGNYLQANDARGMDRFGIRMDHPAVKKLAWCIADDCTYI